jgi:hypothetical protein
MEKNLFGYAKKELSQDAFLCWLFANYDSKTEKLQECSQTLLKKFIGVDGEIIVDNVRSQYKHIDILVECHIEDTKYVILIEDKVGNFAPHDNQLSKYLTIVKEDFKDCCVKAIFFKPYLEDIQNNEKKFVTDNEYTTYYIEDVYLLFEPFSDSNNNILDDYIAHIKEISQNLSDYNVDTLFDNEDAKYSFITKLYTEILRDNGNRTGIKYDKDKGHLPWHFSFTADNWNTSIYFKFYDGMYEVHVDTVIGGAARQSRPEYKKLFSNMFSEDEIRHRGKDIGKKLIRRSDISSVKDLFEKSLAFIVEYAKIIEEITKAAGQTE